MESDGDGDDGNRCRTSSESNFKPNPLELPPVVGGVLAHFNLSEQEELLGVCQTWDDEINFNLVKGKTIHLSIRRLVYTATATATAIDVENVNIWLKDFLLNKAGRNHLYSSFVIDLSSIPDEDPSPFLYTTFMTDYGAQIRSLSLLWKNRVTRINRSPTSDDDRGRIGRLCSTGAEQLLRSVLLENKMPNLRSLTLDCLKLWASTAEFWRRSLLSSPSLPKLRHLTLLGFERDECPVADRRYVNVGCIFGFLCPFPPSIESLHVKYDVGLSHDQLLSLSLHLPALKCIKMVGGSPVKVHLRLTPPQLLSLGAAFPGLEELKVEMNCLETSEVSEAVIFSSAHFPRLKRLEAHCIHNSSSWSNAHILIHSSLQQLESLVLESIPQCVEFELDADTKIFPRLHELRVTRYGERWSASASREQLGWTNPASYTYFPNLRALDLSNSSLPSPKPEELRTIIVCMPQLEDLRLVIDKHAEPILAGFSPEKCAMISEWLEARIEMQRKRWRWRRLGHAFLGAKFCGCGRERLSSQSELLKDGVSISDLKNLKRLELTSTDWKAMSVGILYGISDCVTIQHLNLIRFKLTSHLVYKAIAEKITSLNWLELSVDSMTDMTEKFLRARIEIVCIERRWYERTPTRPSSSKLSLSRRGWNVSMAMALENVIQETRMLFSCIASSCCCVCK